MRNLSRKNIYMCKLSHCKEGNYCKKCIGKLVDESKYETCPICRRENWYKDEEIYKELLKKNYSNIREKMYLIY